MAQNLQQVFQQLQQLANQVNNQSLQEQAADPLFAVALDKLESMLDGIKQVESKLEKEEAAFSKSADMSTYTVEELTEMASDVREASRKLSIVLAAGSNKFQGGTKGDVDTLNDLQSYIASDVMTKLDLPTLTEVLGTQQCPHGYQWQNCCYGCRQNTNTCAHGQYRQNCPYGCNAAFTLTMSGDFKQGATSADSIKKLAKHFSELSKQCDKISNDRSQSTKQKSKKETIKATLKKKFTELVPKLRSHVLRIGIAKGQHLNISNGCANVSTITQLFSYAAVEDAHRQLEDGRDQIMQELTIRKLEAKMNKKSPEKSRF